MFNSIDVCWFFILSFMTLFLLIVKVMAFFNYHKILQYYIGQCKDQLLIGAMSKSCRFKTLRRKNHCFAHIQSHTTLIVLQVNKFEDFYFDQKLKFKVERLKIIQVKMDQIVYGFLREECLYNLEIHYFQHSNIFLVHIFQVMFLAYFFL